MTYIFSGVGIGGRALKDLDGEEPEDEDAELMKTPTWAAAKEQYEAATKARAAFREMVVGKCASVLRL